MDEAKEEGETVSGDDDAVTPACAGDRGPEPEDDNCPLSRR
jgi:hypothetical protein